MSNNYGLSPTEIDAVNIINPEVAAHNIALTYINTSAGNRCLRNDEDVELSGVLSLSSQYSKAYNYAYNFLVHENQLIDEAE